MYYIYILQSQKSNRYYIGYTSNIANRLEAHSRGSSRSTKLGRPWKLIYSEEFNNKKASMKREKEIKSYKGGIAFKNLISKR